MAQGLGHRFGDAIATADRGVLAIGVTRGDGGPSIGPRIGGSRLVEGRRRLSARSDGQSENGKDGGEHGLGGHIDPR